VGANELESSSFGFELALFGFAPLIFDSLLALFGFELGLFWLCFLMKSSFLIEKLGKIGFVLQKKSVLSNILYFSRVLYPESSIPRSGRWTIDDGR
jgi:hypothetical protein